MRGRSGKGGGAVRGRSGKGGGMGEKHPTLIDSPNTLAVVPYCTAPSPPHSQSEA